MTGFSWSQYLELARKIAETWPADEAARRSAISRAYYSCYGEAASSALNSGLRAESLSPELVWNWYKDSGGTNGPKINEVGKRIKGLREKADYRKDFAPREQDIVLALRWAEEVLTMIGVEQSTEHTQE